jgi:hypothetical protein
VTYEAYAVSRTSTRPQVDSAVDMLAEAAHYAGRLAFVITGNVRAEEVVEARRLVNPAWAAIKTEA